MIWSGLPCTEVLSRYFQLMIDLNLPSDIAPAFDYIAHHEPEKFYGFVLVIPGGVTTYWEKKSSIIMSYVHEGDTLSIESSEFLITSERQKVVIYSFEMEGFVPIPNTACKVYQTQNGNPEIFVKFPLEHTPDAIIGCQVTHVRMKRR